MLQTRRRFLAWGAACLVGYAVAGKDNAGTAISDTCFLVGIAGLVWGLWRLVARTGFFFIPRYSFRRFIAIATNKKWSAEPMNESYHKHLLSERSDTSYRSTLLIASAMLLASAVFASM